MKNWKKVGLVVALFVVLGSLLVGCGGLFNQAPTALIQANPVSGKAPLAVSFTAKVTDDGTIVSYEWNFGDGTSAVGANVQHTYKEMGVYTASLRVTDDGGKTATASQTINVLNPGPACDGIGIRNLTGSCSKPYGVNDALNFYVLNARHPAGKMIVEYKWDFGDGSQDYGSSVNHSYGLAGVYTVTLTLSDSEGVSNSFTRSVTIQNCCSACLPNIDIRHYRGALRVGSDITFKGVFTDGYCGACSTAATTKALSATSPEQAELKCCQPCPPPCDPCPDCSCRSGTWEWRIWLNDDLIGSGYGQYITVMPCQTGSMVVFLYYTCGRKTTYAKRTFNIKP